MLSETVFRNKWVEIDLGAVAHNLKLTRKLVGPKVKIYACVKADGLGCGLVPMAFMAANCGADALAVMDANDVITLRRAGLTLPILLFACTLPEQAAELAALDVIPTIHDLPSLEAFAALQRPVEVFIKIGRGRYGFIEGQWEEAFKAVSKAPMLKVKGLYTHGYSDNPESMRNLEAMFERACAKATEFGFVDFEKMLACSRTIIGNPELHLTAVCPGRLLIGHLPRPWPEKAQLQPAICAVKSRITQVQEYPAGSAPKFNYEGDESLLEKPVRTAVAPIGHLDGLNKTPPLGKVLIGGCYAPVLSRGVDSTVIDVTDVPNAKVGDEVVLIGRQGSEVITDHELADSINLTVLELFVRLARNTHRVYLNSNLSETAARQLSNWSKAHSRSTGTYITGLED
jgi:alanine racemase